MGTGKTTLVKEGISKILGRDFAFIALGGATDSSFLEGHSYTYEGSSWGKTVDILISSKSMNPVIYFDELDKVSTTSRGQEIINLLIHLTDTSQNSNFQDKYYSGIQFDLSKAIYVFSFNTLENVNPILRDRMNLIKVNGFDAKEKLEIARQFLIPNIMTEYHMNLHDVVFNDEVINYIISKNQDDEHGVRNIRRRFEQIISKLNVMRLFVGTGDVREDTKSPLKRLKVTDMTFPLELNNKLVDKILVFEKNEKQPPHGMYI
jgi:ATP-dependent Lon protease